MIDSTRSKGIRRGRVYRGDNSWLRLFRSQFNDTITRYIHVDTVIQEIGQSRETKSTAHWYIEATGLSQIDELYRSNNISLGESDRAGPLQSLRDPSATGHS